MSNRMQRLEVLRVILSTNEMGSHEAILEELARNGWTITQATLSRDLSKLHAAKILSTDGYRYILPDNPNYRRTLSPEVMSHYMRGSGFLSIRFSGNLAVLHTRPGYASGLAVDIDTQNLPTVLGTIAGDDTILIVVKEGIDREEFVEELSKVIPPVKAFYKQAEADAEP